MRRLLPLRQELRAGVGTAGRRSGGSRGHRSQPRVRDTDSAATDPRPS